MVMTNPNPVPAPKTDTPAAQPVSAPSPEIPDDLKDEYSLASYDDEPAFWGSDVREYIERIGRAESALRAAREERDRAQSLARSLDDSLMAQYDQWLREREARKQEAAAIHSLEVERSAAQAYTLRLRQLIYAGDRDVRRRAEREIDEMSLASVLELAKCAAEKALAALSKPVSGSPER
jgi:hypothetical protein